MVNTLSSNYNMNIILINIPKIKKSKYNVKLCYFCLHMRMGLD